MRRLYFVAFDGEEGIFHARRDLGFRVEGPRSKTVPHEERRIYLILQVRQPERPYLDPKSM